MNRKRIISLPAPSEQASSCRQKGATVIEYALIAGLLSIASVVVLGQVGVKLDGSYQDVAAATATANS